jgi:transcriptional regulator with XRE-family HTH domain
MHEIIRRRRAQLGLSGADLAQKAGVGARQLRRYESGETEPTLTIAKKLAAALGIADEGATRSKGAMHFALHRMANRPPADGWTGPTTARSSAGGEPLRTPRTT